MFFEFKVIISLLLLLRVRHSWDRLLLFCSKSCHTWMLLMLHVEIWILLAHHEVRRWIIKWWRLLKSILRHHKLIGHKHWSILLCIILIIILPIIFIYIFSAIIRISRSLFSLSSSSFFDFPFFINIIGFCF
jgi:hypothetical protein